jgi:hypothetical protein
VYLTSHELNWRFSDDTIESGFFFHYLVGLLIPPLVYRGTVGDVPTRAAYLWPLYMLYRWRCVTIKFESYER